MKFERILKCLALCTLALLFSACTQTFTVTVDPEVYVNPSGMGKDRPVGVQVVDRRSDKFLGKGKGAFVKFNKFKIVANDDVSDVVKDRVFEGLREIRFRPKPLSGQERKFRVEILQIRDAYFERVIRGSLKEKISVAVQASCINGKHTYRNKYRNQKEHDHKLIGGNFPNEKLINQTLSLTLQSMFEDKKLLECLKE